MIQYQNKKKKELLTQSTEEAFIQGFFFIFLSTNTHLLHFSKGVESAMGSGSSKKKSSKSAAGQRIYRENRARRSRSTIEQDFDTSKLSV